MSFSPSPYQQNVFNFIKNGSGNAIVEAVAGSGKTTTIIQSLSFIPRGKSVLFLAFNKSVVNELKTKVPRHVEVATYHSVGFRAIRFALRGRRINIDNDKVYNIIKTINFKDRQEFGIYAGAIKQLVSLCKSYGFGILDTCPSMNEIAEHHDLFNRYPDALDFETLKKHVIYVIAKARKQTSSIDFDDMIYMPMVINASFKRYDYVFIDEAQDTSHVQRFLLNKMLKYNGRLVAVGDSSQAIYGFRGADSNSMNAIKEDFNATSLPLSISYRCAKAIVTKAQTVNDQILPFEKNPEGEVRFQATYQPSDFGSKDAILCRNTAPLIDMAFSLIRNGISPNVLGRDIGKGLASLCNKWKRITKVDALLEKLGSTYQTAITKANGDESKVTALNDQIATIKIFANECPDNRVSTLVSIINNFFSEAPDNRITLCTVHKSKGLEWHKVFLLDPDKFQPCWVRMDWQRVQERNIEYVAITRAKEELVYIESNSWA
tara:strand:- start:68 stop:1537 length:1470 start_codon:yes stop_codon:yes gene_type:complete